MRKRIGMSTFMLRDRSFAEVVPLIAGKLAGIEICPAFMRSLHSSSQGQRVVDPDSWRNTVARTELAELRELVSGFSFRTVHAAMSGKHCAVASLDATQRKEAWERCFDAIRLGAGINAELVTFHPSPSFGGRSGYDKNRAQEHRRHFVEFGRRAAKLATQFDLKLGFELFDYSLIDEIGHPNFGILFDIGHTYGFDGPPEECTDRAMRVLAEAGDRIVEFHFHGIRWTGERYEDHVDFRMNDCLDYKRIVRFAKQRNMDAPWLCEIEWGIRDTEAVIAAAEYARDILVSAWQEEQANQSSD